MNRYSETYKQQISKKEQAEQSIQELYRLVELNTKKEKAKTKIQVLAREIGTNPDALNEIRNNTNEIRNNTNEIEQIEPKIQEIEKKFNIKEKQDIDIRIKDLRKQIETAEQNIENLKQEIEQEIEKKKNSSEISELEQESKKIIETIKLLDEQLDNFGKKTNEINITEASELIKNLLLKANKIVEQLETKKQEQTTDIEELIKVLETITTTTTTEEKINIELSEQPEQEVEIPDIDIHIEESKEQNEKEENIKTTENISETIEEEPDLSVNKKIEDLTEELDILQLELELTKTEDEKAKIQENIEQIKKEIKKLQQEKVDIAEDIEQHDKTVPSINEQQSEEKKEEKQEEQNTNLADMSNLSELDSEPIKEEELVQEIENNEPTENVTEKELTIDEKINNLDARRFELIMKGTNVPAGSAEAAEIEKERERIKEELEKLKQEKQNTNLTDTSNLSVSDAEPVKEDEQEKGQEKLQQESTEDLSQLLTTDTLPKNNEKDDPQIPMQNPDIVIPLKEPASPHEDLPSDTLESNTESEIEEKKPESKINADELFSAIIVDVEGPNNYESEQNAQDETKEISESKEQTASNADEQYARDSSELFDSPKPSTEKNTTPKETQSTGLGEKSGQSTYQKNVQSHMREIENQSQPSSLEQEGYTFQPKIVRPRPQTTTYEQSTTRQNASQNEQNAGELTFEEMDKMLGLGNGNSYNSSVNLDDILYSAMTETTQSEKTGIFKKVKRKVTEQEHLGKTRSAISSLGQQTKEEQRGKKK